MPPVLSDKCTTLWKLISSSWSLQTFTEVSKFCIVTWNVIKHHWINFVCDSSKCFLYYSEEFVFLSFSNDNLVRISSNSLFNPLTSSSLCVSNLYAGLSNPSFTSFRLSWICLMQFIKETIHNKIRWHILYYTNVVKKGVKLTVGFCWCKGNIINTIFFRQRFLN